jgi:hypothetical protein
MKTNDENEMSAEEDSNIDDDENLISQSEEDSNIDDDENLISQSEEETQIELPLNKEDDNETSDETDGEKTT